MLESSFIISLSCIACEDMIEVEWSISNTDTNGAVRCSHLVVCKRMVAIYLGWDKVQGCPYIEGSQLHNKVTFSHQMYDISCTILRHILV